MKIIFSFIFIFIFQSIAFSAVSVKVVNVHDGDSITVKQGSKKPYKVRLYGIDAPELSQNFGNSSRRNLQKLLKDGGTTIQLKGVDSYGRSVGVVYAGKSNVNELQVKQGYAWHYKAYSKSKELESAQKYAKVKKLGLWADKEPIPPWEYRKQGKDDSREPIFDSFIKGLSICLDGKTDKIYMKAGKCPKGSLIIME